jgi:single-stranded-DNA-specific exonuclease
VTDLSVADGGLPHPAPLWIPPTPPAPEAVSRLERELHLPGPLCALLVARGIHDVDAAKRHLRPLIEHLHPPELMADANVAVDRLLAAAARGEKVLVHGDYDVDGVCAAALYTIWLRRLGAQVIPFVPHRLRDGYDFGNAGIEHAERSGARVILTADCGTVAHGAIEEAHRRGMDVIVTDHHTPSATLPPALAIVNPNRADCAYPDKSLSGSGVAFKVCQLLAARRKVPLEELLPHLDLVALATVADLVSLEGENRVLVRYGLRALSATAKPGLRALLEVTGTPADRVESGKVGFVLAPRINAVGRLGDAAEGLRLMLTSDDGEARALATRLDDINKQRQQEDRRTLDEALAILRREFDATNEFGVVLAAEGWHPGVIGIVASRVVERIHRPTILVALDGERGRGSGRSIPGFDLHHAVSACATHLGRFGGHKQAAGMDLTRDALPAFRAAFQNEARTKLQGSELRPTLRVDLELSPADATLPLVERLRFLGPHGMGNPKPTFLGRGLELAEPARVVGSGHLRVRLKGDGCRLDGIGFRMAERVPPETLGRGPVDAVFQLQADDYRGEVRVQAKLLDVRPSAPQGAPQRP